MTEDDRNTGQISILPPEILLDIFNLLPAADLGKCRRVCVRFKTIIDDLRNDRLWRVKCKNDFSNVYEAARTKARQGLRWANIYKSLTMWPRLSSAKEVRHDFSLAQCIGDEVRNFELQSNGIIGVHKRRGIIYYDIETRKPTTREGIPGDYVNYTQNENTLVLSNYHSHLFIVHKFMVNNRKCERNVMFDQVKISILVNKESLVFYATMDNEISVCNLAKDLRTTFIKPCSESIMSMGYANKHLHVLTYERNIFTVKNNDLVLASRLDDHKNLLNQVHKYDLFEYMDWRMFLQWMCTLGHKVPVGPLQNIITVRTYGEVAFVGCNWGVLYIYYAPYNEGGEFDIYNSRPMKQYNFMEHTEPVFTMCPIIQVDVQEAEHGHKVVIGLPKKIISLDYIHKYSILSKGKESKKKGKKGNKNK